jgi:CRP/FNR family transcriptional regulator, cyclic AMP receptor protein
MKAQAGLKRMLQMIDLTPQDSRFKLEMKEFFRTQICSHAVRIAKNHIVYYSGQKDPTVYFLMRGKIKLLLSTAEGKECLLGLRTEGDLVGELCFSGASGRIETAIAMDDVLLKQMSYRDFLEGLKRSALLNDLIRYLTVRLSEQQELIATLVTANSEQRLAKTLLYLSRTLGTRENGAVSLGYRFSRGELSKMVGTTRSRVGAFLKKFGQLGLISTTENRCLVVVEGKLRKFVDCQSCPARTSDDPYCVARRRRVTPTSLSSGGAAMDA